MKKIVAGITAILMVCGTLTACGKTEEKSKSDESKVSSSTTQIVRDNTESLNNNENDYNKESSVSETSRSVINDTFNDIEYLEEDDVFKLTTESGATYTVNKNGKASFLTEQTLKSKVITQKDNMVFDVYGNDITDRFITDSDNESILEVLETDNCYVVWTIKEEETPTSSKCTVTGYDYDGNILLRIDDDKYDFVSKIGDFSGVRGDSFYPIYLGKNIYGFVSDSIYEDKSVYCFNLKTDEYFEFTMRDGDKFDKGYIIDPNWNSIIDSHGNTVFDDDDKLSKDIYNVGEGMILNFYKSKFYNINDLSLAIDLSEYSFVRADEFWEETKKDAFEFIDGYCGIRMANENNTYFFGVIDTSGKWVMEPIEVDGFTSGSYHGEITKGLLDINNQIYNIETGEFEENPVKPKYQTNSIVLDGTAYFIDDNGYFCSYDYDNQDYSTIEVYMD